MFVLNQSKTGFCASFLVLLMTVSGTNQGPVSRECSPNKLAASIEPLNYLIANNHLTPIFNLENVEELCPACKNFGTCYTEIVRETCGDGTVDFTKQFFNNTMCGGIECEEE